MTNLSITLQKVLYFTESVDIVEDNACIIGVLYIII